MSEKLNYKKAEKDGIDSGEAVGSVNAGVNTSMHNSQIENFHASQGHGFAAEQANHQIDIANGKDAHIVGSDNAKDGADRLVDGVNIQTKYCIDAYHSVDAAFNKQGQYRYINADGSPMQLEVPADQYDDAVKEMAKRIERGQVKGITDSNEARKLVRKGHVTYEQARNIAKAGNIDSLIWDAKNATVISLSTIGITATIIFARSVWNGEDTKIAMEKSLVAGLQMGGAAFATAIITAQLTKAGLNSALVGVSKDFTNLLPNKVTSAIVNANNAGANIYGGAAVNKASKLLRNNVITATVMIIVLSAPDIAKCFQGKISGKQLFKNMMKLAGAMGSGAAGGAVGALAGAFIAGPIGAEVGFWVGSFAGGAIGGNAISKQLDKFIEDDAIALVKILENKFVALAQEYMLSELEMNIVLDDLRIILQNQNTLLDMFVSSNRELFAEKLERDLIEKRINSRCRILLPSDEELINGFQLLENDYSNEMGIFSKDYGKAVDTVEFGKRILGRELKKNVADKAFYHTQQMQLTQGQTEQRLKGMVCVEKKYKQNLQKIKEDRRYIKEELSEFFN